MKNIAHNQVFANVVLIVSLFCSLYWAGVFLIEDVYAWALVGAVYEILWLPGLAVIYLLPVFILILAIVNKFKINSKYYIGLGLLALIITLLFTVFT